MHFHFLSTLVVPRAYAANGGYTPGSMHVAIFGANIDIVSFMANAVGLFSMTVGLVCTILFLIGALYMVLSTGSPDRLGKGQKLMTESLIGLAIVLGAYAILRTIYFLIY